MENLFVGILLILNCLCVSREIQESLSNDGRLDHVENMVKDALKILSEHQDDLIKMESKLDLQDEIVHDLQKETRSKRQSPLVIAFTSKISHPLTNLTNNEVIKFDNPITNVGGAYIPTTGEFICPVNGLYEFAASISSSGSGQNVEIEMVRDGQALMTIHATGYTHDSGTQIVIIECIEGQTVWVRHVAGKDSDATMAGNSFFSGHLIHAD